ncbi:integral membrane protein [Patellaria atrata CBS 101060]|uniref:Integral membrane protein n=1 Tax=Patellaria atrata CBS 101060 TaxID=1346257 RepID=A0A9P4SGT7_9PEZI|nr:integral membrane protein [Patellaria atrata CBS 101060]
MADPQAQQPPLNYESVGKTVNTICIVFGSVTTVVIALRLFTRFCVVKAVGPDDILITIATLLSWAFIAATIRSVDLGLGSHIGVVMLRGPENFMNYMQIVWLSSMFYNATLGFLKVSVLALYMRLGDRVLRKMAFVMVIIVSCQASANVFTCIFQCNPIKAAWDLSITDKVCVNINAFYLANAALNIATDLLTYTLPIRLVINLQVPRNQKIALGIMLCLGLFACISSIIRISFIPRMLTDPDATWAISGAMYWSVIETNIGICAASIPSFKALAKRYLPRILGSDYSGNGNSASAYGKKSNVSSNGHFQRLGPNGQPVKLRTLSVHNGGIHGPADYSGIKNGKGGVNVNIEQDAMSNSSEERLNVPQGRIQAKTEITTHVSNDDTSFYSHEEDKKYGVH